MRKHSLLILMILIRCSSPSESVAIEERNGLMYKKGTNELFTGLRTEDFKDGQIAFRAPYEKGVMNGKTIFWHENGKKKTEGQTINGKKEGEWKSWFDSGNQSLVASYVNNEESGRYRQFYENGKLSTDCLKTRGKLNGSCKTY